MPPPLSLGKHWRWMGADLWQPHVLSTWVLPINETNEMCNIYIDIIKTELSSAFSKRIALEFSTFFITPFFSLRLADC